MAASPAPSPKPRRERGNPSLRERFDAMRNLPPFLRQIWQTSRTLTVAAIGLRLLRAFLPIATLYVGKLIIDEAVRLIGLGLPHELATAWHGGQLDHIVLLLGLELALAIASDLLGRLAGYVGGLLSELFTDAVKSVKAP